MKDLKLNTSYQAHLFIAIITGIWLVVFLILIAPFDIAELSLVNRLILMPPYGLIAIIGYLLMIPLQNLLYRKTGKWTILQEILIALVFNICVLIGSYAYYTSDLINGKYSFGRFTLEVYYPTFTILFFLIVISRWFLFSGKTSLPPEKIHLKGDNKLDVLHIDPKELISISSADNYVEVNYLKESKLHKKLLRNTLKGIHQQMPSLIQVHRSYLINPDHFVAWKSSSILMLTQMEVPVTKSYKSSEAFLNSIPKNL